MSTNFSFQKGWSQIQNKDLKAVKEEIMTALNIKARVNWYSRLNGKVEPRVSEAHAIEGIFAKYDVTDIWGN